MQVGSFFQQISHFFHVKLFVGRTRVVEALLEQVTVLIGIAYHGRPVAGVIHQPYHGGAGRTVWAIRGCGVHGIVPSPGKWAAIEIISPYTSHSFF